MNIRSILYSKYLITLVVIILYTLLLSLPCKADKIDDIAKMLAKNETYIFKKCYQNEKLKGEYLIESMSIIDGTYTRVVSKLIRKYKINKNTNFDMFDDIIYLNYKQACIIGYNEALIGNNNIDSEASLYYSDAIHKYYKILKNMY